MRASSLLSRATTLSTNTQPVSSYRYLLSTSANYSVTIAVIGFFDNLYNLTNSGPDSISPYTGAQLLSLKVRELVVQAREERQSFNTGRGSATDPRYAEKILNEWPGNLTFVGNDVTSNTYIGARITTELDNATNPIAYAFGTNIGYNQTHQVWDAVAVYYAVCGLDDVFKWKYPGGGRVHLNASAYATWQVNETAPGWQNALTFSVMNTTFAERLEDTLLWEPGKDVPKKRSWCRN